MLGLILRKEFQGRRLKGTAIELTNENKTGATQISPKEFLEITYPSGDVLKAIEAIGPNQDRPVVLIGERGLGKSHLLATLFHAITNSKETKNWLKEWGQRLGEEKISNLPLRSGMHVISESLQQQNYKFLWDIVFKKHPHGDFILGKWEAQGAKKTNVPGSKLLIELFQHTPTILILDEFQTWFDGLVETAQKPYRSWAFNFIQILSEIAKEHPDLFVLVVSVRNGNTDAYQQIHRIGPVLVDFKGPNAKIDRQRLLLHRLFENRLQIPCDQIDASIALHIKEYLRLKDVPPAEHDKVRREFIEAWPFAPHLMQLLEDQVLIATQAQETRDLIRIMADIYKHSAIGTPLITAADFRLNDEKSGVAALLDSVANQHHATLREKALRNMVAVNDAVKNPQKEIPHLSEIISSLWLRSLSVGNIVGADSKTLQIDITKSNPVDENAFQVELNTIVENSFNIHEIGKRLIFKDEENPQARLMANARNDKQFADGSDIQKLAREIRVVLGESSNNTFHVIVLQNNWLMNPWNELEEKDQPNQWDDRIPILVLPEIPDKLSERLGKWLKDQMQKRRNAIRFLLPIEGSLNLFTDRDLLILARVVLLAEQWKTQNAEYRKLQEKYEKELREILKKRFDRFAILSTWDYQHPEKCTFHIEHHKSQGSKIPETMDDHIRKNLFIEEDFQEIVLQASKNNDSVGKLFNELQEPRTNGKECIPWLGEIIMKEKLIRLCTRGLIALNIRNAENLQKKAGEEEELAWNRMKSKLGTGRHLSETYIQQPQPEPHTQTTGISGSSAKDSSDNQNVLTSKGIEYNPKKPATSESANPIFNTGKKLKPYSSEATSSLNLLGKIDSWSISPGSQIHDMTLKVGRLTGAQLNNLLRKLPDGYTYELLLQKEED